METGHLLKLLSDSFGPKAESIDVESFHLYFEDRPSILAKIKGSNHQFIVGRKGTGKTMFLKYLDLATFASDSGAIKEPSAIGFYIPLGKFAIPNINYLSTKYASAIFSKWLPLKCMISVLHGIEKGIKTELFQTDKQCLDSIACRMTNEDNPNGAFNKLKTTIEELIQQLESFSSGQNFDVQELHDTIKSPLRNVPLEGLLNDVSVEIRLMLKDKYKNIPGIFFLLDRYDELLHPLQRFIKPLIYWGNPQAYYLKLGVTCTDNLTLRDVPYRDYGIISIEFPPVPEGKKDYRNFATAVVKKRLDYISESIQKEDSDDAISLALLDISRLLPASADKENLILYAGIEVLEKISARNIAIFLSYVYAVLLESISDPDGLNLLRSTGRIPPDLQHKAIKMEDSNRFTQEFPSQVRSSAKKLYRFLINNLYSGEDSHYAQFTLTGEISSKVNETVNEALRELELANVISRTEDTDLSLTYELSQFFFPQSGRALETHGTKEIAISECTNYVTGEPRKHKASQIDQKELFEQKPVCFFPTGFRKPWENKVRSLLQESIFDEVGIEYKDGAMYHPNSNEIGECVKCLMQEVDFFIIEVSTFNENVAFEIGLATAIKRPTYAIRNKKVTVECIEVKPSAEFRELIEGYKHKSYEFEYEDEELSSPAKESYVKSLGSAIKFFVNIFKELPESKQRNINPFDSSQHLIPAKPTDEKIVFIYSPPGSRYETWKSDIEKTLREEKIANPYPSVSLKGREQIIMSRLKAICRSTHCVIDTSGKDQYACLLLGFTMALERGPEILHVYDKENAGLFTNWKGWPHHPYDSKNELWNLIKEFIQST